MSLYEHERPQPAWQFDPSTATMPPLSSSSSSSTPYSSAAAAAPRMRGKLAKSLDDDNGGEAQSASQSMDDSSPSPPTASLFHSASEHATNMAHTYLASLRRFVVDVVASNLAVRVIAAGTVLLNLLAPLLFLRTTAAQLTIGFFLASFVLAHGVYWLAGRTPAVASPFLSWSVLLMWLVFPDVRAMHLDEQTLFLMDQHVPLPSLFVAWHHAVIAWNAALLAVNAMSLLNYMGIETGVNELHVIVSLPVHARAEATPATHVFRFSLTASSFEPSDFPLRWREVRASPTRSVGGEQAAVLPASSKMSSDERGEGRVGELETEEPSAPSVKVGPDQQQQRGEPLPEAAVKQESQQHEPSPAKQHEPSPVKQHEPSPAKQHEPSPAKQLEPSHVQQREPSQQQRQQRQQPIDTPREALKVEKPYAESHVPDESRAASDVQGGQHPPSQQQPPPQQRASHAAPHATILAQPSPQQQQQQVPPQAPSGRPSVPSERSETERMVVLNAPATSSPSGSVAPPTLPRSQLKSDAQAAQPAQATQQQQHGQQSHQQARTGSLRMEQQK